VTPLRQPSAGHYLDRQITGGAVRSDRIRLGTDIHARQLRASIGPSQREVLLREVATGGSDAFKMVQSAIRTVALRELLGDGFSELAFLVKQPLPTPALGSDADAGA
jgi:hypothetical protein